MFATGANWAVHPSDPTDESTARAAARALDGRFESVDCA